MDNNEDDQLQRVLQLSEDHDDEILDAILKQSQLDK